MSCIKVDGEILKLALLCSLCFQINVFTPEKCSLCRRVIMQLIVRNEIL